VKHIEPTSINIIPKLTALFTEKNMTDELRPRLRLEVARVSIVFGESQGIWDGGIGSGLIGNFQSKF
jgi:hypothetical protein|tara:strand:+ start:606 stop:806 length:201 start_codon:yes stop_codon:yes gene_type:complete